jgi:hypothetical protein
MTTKIAALGDRMLASVLPQKRASACTYPSSCQYRYRGCGGGYCYYYYQWGSYCYVYEGIPTLCYGNLVRKYQGCC